MAAPLLAALPEARDLLGTLSLPEAAAVLQKTETASNVTLPLSGPVTFTCNGKAIPLLKSVCSAATSLGVVANGVSVKDVKTYNPTPLF